MNKIFLFILIILVLLSFCGNSQTKTPVAPMGNLNTITHYKDGFAGGDSVTLLHVYADTPSINMNNYQFNAVKYGSIILDTISGNWKGWNPVTKVWSVISSGGGGGSTLFSLNGLNTAVGNVTGALANHNLTISGAGTLALGANIYNFLSTPATYVSGGFNVLGYNQSSGNIELVPTSVSASNGVNVTFGDVELGGTLTKNTSIQTGTFGLTIQSNQSALPLQVSAQNNVAFNAITFTGAYAGGFSAVSGTTNAVSTLLRLTNAANGVAGASGIGGSIDFNNYTSVNQNISNRLISQWSDATDATRTSQFTITGVNSGGSNSQLTLAGTGQLTLNQYGIGSFTSGTPVYVLATTSAGKIIETSVPSANVIVDSVVLTFDGFHADTTFNLTRAGFKNLEVQAEQEQAGGFVQEFNSTQAVLQWQAAILGSYKFYITYYY